MQLIIADDHQLFLNGLQLLLKNEPGLEIMDIARDGKELLHLLREQQPDLILLDINMPELDGLETTRFIKQSYPQIKIIILSTYNDAHLLEKAKQFGVNGYLLKNCSREELLSTIDLVSRGHSCFPYNAPPPAKNNGKPDSLIRKYNFTRREMEIIQLIKADYTNQQIAEKLFLSIYTVETHRKNIMHKAGLKSPVALMKFILEHKL